MPRCAEWATMYRIMVNGIEVRCDTEDEALRLARLAARPENPTSTVVSATPRARGRPPLYGKSHRAKREAAAVDTSHRFLEMLNAAGTSGITSGRLVEVFALPHARAVGGMMVTVRKTVTTLGFRPDDVFARKGKPGSRRWVPAPRLSEAIAAFVRNNT